MVEEWRKCYKVKEGDLQSTDNNLASTHDGVVPNKIVAVTIPFEAPNLSDVNTKKGVLNRAQQTDSNQHSVPFIGMFVPSFYIHMVHFSTVA